MNKKEDIHKEEEEENENKSILYLILCYIQLDNLIEEILLQY